MYRLLLLLLPLAAASGWWTARQTQQNKNRATTARNPVYSRSLNYLLNEQPDKAIDAFIQLLENDDETVETQLMLGNLFRRRGEVDRAIRLHQSLIERQNLSEEQRGLSLLELGQDYLRAGLLDRATQLFHELVDLGYHRERALMNLKEIYQQEKDWERCLQAARQLEQLNGVSQAIEMAHYHCEQAELALAASEYDTAAALLTAALAIDARCVRASLLQAQLAQIRGHLPAALRYYHHAIQQDSDWLNEILPKLIDYYRQQGDTPALIDYLHTLHATRKDTVILLALVEFTREQSGAEFAENLLMNHLRQQPDLFSMERFVTWQYERLQNMGEMQEFLQILRTFLHRLLAQQPAYQCTSCGFAARRLYWQCPSCNSWSTLRPAVVHSFDTEKIN